MAKGLVPTTTCDWHSSLPAPASIQGNNERTLGIGKVLDLCDTCACVFDFCYPRLDQIRALLQPAVIDALCRSARDPQPSQRVPAQLALTPGQTPVAPTSGDKAEKSSDGTGGKAKLGAWRDDVVQVRCPLPHRRGSSRKYWVSLRDRTNHARSHKRHDGTPYDGPDVAFELQPGQTYTHFCAEHQVCAENGGYGFISQAALTAHLAKSTGWKQATQEAKGAAETRLRAQAA